MARIYTLSIDNNIIGLAKPYLSIENALLLRENDLLEPIPRKVSVG